jgi:hypothetical protein
MSNGLRREQAIEVIARQRDYDASEVAKQRKAKLDAKKKGEQ